MKKLRLLAIGMAIGAIMTVSAAAQTATLKIGLIDSGMFASEKDGIKRYVDAMKQLSTEMKPSETELITMQNKMQTLSDQIATLQKTPSTVPTAAKDIQSKQDEGQRVQREFEFKKKEYDARIEKRGNEILGPIQADIGKAIQDFANQKGYTMILDIDKLAQNGALLAMDPKSDITKDFITFFNAKQPTTATTAAPK
jgi:Skp family chaperone for outer membrane proteins